MEKSELAKLHTTEKEILDEFVRICDAHSLNYCLIAGTLLGAVRHRGFIPWDDDIDVAMPREDFMRFIDVANYELDKKFFLQSTYTDKNWFRIFAKIRMKNTVFLESGRENFSENDGIFIDIFPLDCGNKHGQIYEKLKNKYVNIIKGHIRMAYHEIPINFSHSILQIFPLEVFIKIRDSWFKKEGNYYISYGSNCGTLKQTMPKEWYEPYAMLEFEGDRYKVPGQYDKVLSKLYGNNYMELPPEDKRKTHNPVQIVFE